MFKRQCLMFISILCLIASGFYAGKASADTNWYQVAANTTLVADWMQTREIADNPNFYERNPILGRSPSQNDVNKYFIASITITNIIGELLPEQYGNYFYLTVATVETIQVYKNVRIGVQFKW